MAEIGSKNKDFAEAANGAAKIDGEKEKKKIALEHQRVFFIHYPPNKSPTTFQKMFVDCGAFSCTRS